LVSLTSLPRLPAAATWTPIRTHPSKAPFTQALLRTAAPWRPTYPSATHLRAGGNGGSWLSGDNHVDLSYTGPESDNKVTIRNNNDTRVNTTNNVTVLNTTAQSAVSGDVHADRNTTVGGLSSGDATNDSNVTTSVNISN
jgi:hypothetical protein